MAHCGKGLVSVFQEFLASIGKSVILAGGLGIFLIFPNFLSLSSFGKSGGNSNIPCL